mmetsp:Transcript_26209/g.46798  ORF Transcript_26209/g.46798 Transcript_26209/m.46798 type:complete len:1273 (-) Transcript_26209:779-4597(-)
MTLLYYLSALHTINYVKKLSEEDFLEKIVLCESSTLPFIVKIHLLLVAAFDKVLIVPLVAGVFKFTTAFPEIGTYCVPAMIAIFLVVLLPIHLIGFLMMTPINWRTSYQALAYPHYSLFQAVFLYSAAAVSVLLSLENYRVYHPVALILVGAAQCSFIFSCIPYSKLNVNFSKLIQGFLLFFGGLVLELFYFTVQSEDSESFYFAPLVYFLTAPPLIIVMRHILKRKCEQHYKVKNINSVSDFEFSLRRYLDLGEDQDKKKAKIKKRIDACALKEASKHPIVCIWMTYFSLLTNDVLMTQLYMSVLRNQGNSSLLYIHKLILAKEVTVAIDQMPDHSETHKFIYFYQSVEHLLELDYQACMSVHSFFTELIGIGAKYEQLAVKAKKMHDAIAEAKKIYRKLMSKNKNNHELLSYFAGFIDATESESKASIYYSQALKEKSYIEKKFSSKISHVNYLDPKCCSFIISAESSDFGTVLWQKNCTELEMSESEIMDSKFEFFVPRLFDDLHESRLERLKRYELGVTKKAFGILKSGKILHVLSRLELVNHADGSLGFLLGVRILKTNILGLGLLVDGMLTLATASMKEFLKQEFEVKFDHEKKTNIQALFCANFNARSTELYKCKYQEKEVLRLMSKKSEGNFKETTHYLVLELMSLEESGAEKAITPLMDSKKNVRLEVMVSTNLTRQDSISHKKLSVTPDHLNDTDNDPHYSGMHAFSSQGSSSSVAVLVTKSIKMHRQAVRKLTTWLRMSYIVSLMFLLICCVIFNVITHETVIELSNSVDSINSLAMMRTVSIRTCYYSKMLSLIGKGVKVGLTEDEARGNLEGFVGTLKDLSTEFRSSLTNEGDSSHNENSLLWWEYRGTYIEKHTTLYDMLESQINYLEKVSGLPAAQINDDLWEYQAVQVNMPYYAFHYLNRTVTGIVENSQRSVKEAMELYTFLLIVTATCYSFCFLAIFTPSFLRLFWILKKFWHVYEAIPSHSIFTMMTTVCERVNDIHIQEIIADNERSSSHKSRRIYVRLTRKQWLLGLMTVLIWSALGVFTGLMIDFGSTQFFTVLKTKPEFLNMIGMQRSCMERSLYYMSEVAWPDNYWNYKSHYGAPYYGFENSKDCVHYAATKNVELDNGNYHKLTEQLLNDARSTDLSSPHLGKGLYIAIKDTARNLDYASMELIAGKDWETATGNLFDYYADVIDAVYAAQLTYQDDTTSLIDELNGQLKENSILFNIFLVVFYLVIIDQLILQIREQAMSEIMLLRNIARVVDKEYEVKLRALAID